MFSRLREWYIAAIGLLLIAGGLYFASQQRSDGGAKNAEVKQAANVTSAPEAAKVPNSQSKSSSQGPPKTEAEPVNKASSSPAASADPAAAPNVAQSAAPPAHNHSAAETTNIAQAPAAAPSQPSSNVGATSAPIAGGDPAAGKLVFRKCQVCHSLDPGKDVLGPSFAGIVGRKSGAEPNYAYSPAMKDANLTWDAKTLDAYLDDPQKFVPGNKMPFPGLKTQQDRIDVIAFLAAPAASAAVQSSPGCCRRAASWRPAQPKAPRPHRRIHPGCQIHAAIRYRRGSHGVYRRRRRDRRQSQSGLDRGRRSGHPAHADQWRRCRARYRFPDQDAKSPRVTGKGASTTIAFRATKSGDFVYFCSVPGHRQAGMEGQFTVTPRLAPQTVVEADISREPTDLPPTDRQTRSADSARRSFSPRKSKAGSPRARPSATGPSTARCRVRSSACASATPSTFT